MPPDPVRRDAEPAAPGRTFYGVHSFSDKILFIIDVSGSMDQVPGGEEGGGRQKIEVAREQLAGYINNLGATDRFNVVFFNHEVMPWQPKMLEATEPNKRQAIKWIRDQPPLGGTNIHDALEEGFRIALRATGARSVDTIFFLTDGKATNGKVQDPEKILAEVREWNRTAGIRIHSIAVGEHDEVLLRGLAEGTGGKYVVAGK